MSDTVVIEAEDEFVVVDLAEQGPAGPSGSSVPATSTSLGGIIAGSDFAIATNGTLSLANQTSTGAFGDSTHSSHIEIDGKGRVIVAQSVLIQPDYSSIQNPPNLTVYLTTTAAASTYATIASLSSYLTTASAASTYATIASLSSYLTTAAAASTYQTIAGMSGYLTSATAATTYAPLASPALTGNPTAPTQTAGTNNTTLATTAFVATALTSYVTTANFTFSNLGSKPTTVSGYGITDAATTGANTFTGNQTFNGNLLIKPKLAGYQEPNAALAITAGNVTIDLSQTNFFTLSHTAAITSTAWNITNVPNAANTVAEFALEITYGATAYGLTWDSRFKWPSGTAPTLTNTNGKTDTFVFYSKDGGSNWKAYTSGQNQA